MAPGVPALRRVQRHTGPRQGAGGTAERSIHRRGQHVVPPMLRQGTHRHRRCRTTDTAALWTARHRGRRTVVPRANVDVSFLCTAAQCSAPAESHQRARMYSPRPIQRWCNSVGVSPPQQQAKDAGQPQTPRVHALPSTFAASSSSAGRDWFNLLIGVRWHRHSV